MSQTLVSQTHRLPEPLGADAAGTVRDDTAQYGLDRRMLDLRRLRRRVERGGGNGQGQVLCRDGK